MTANEGVLVVLVEQRRHHDERERVEQFSTISEQLKSAIETDENLRKQTQQLSQALSSNSLRGVWGEAQLRKLVELAGLIKHAAFSEQATIATGDKSGRADMVINLPGGKALAIDSKVPFDKYQEASTISELAGGEELERRKKLLAELDLCFKRARAQCIVSLIFIPMLHDF